MKFFKLFLLLSFVFQVYGQLCVEITVDSANVRSSPAGSVAGQVSKGQRTTLRGLAPQRKSLGGVSYDWLPIGSFNGWIASSLVKPCSVCTTTTTSGLNIRSSPCGSAVSSYSQGAKFTPTSGSVSYCFNRYYYWVKGPSGWVAADYLKTCPSTTPPPPPPPPSSGGCNSNTKPSSTGQKGVNIIKKWEGLYKCWYLDPVNLPTICYGHLIVAGDPYKKGTCLTEAQCESLLKAKDLPKYEKCVKQYISVPLNQNQFDALVSFTFNVGCGALQSSSLRTRLNKGEYSGVCPELKRWVHAGGRVLQGLVNRRNDECNLFTSCSGVPQLSQSVTCPEADECDSCVVTHRADILETYDSNGVDTSCSASNWAKIASDFCSKVEPWTCHYLSPQGTQGNESTPACPTCNYDAPIIDAALNDVNVDCFETFGNLCAENDCAVVAGNDTVCCNLTGDCLQPDEECKVPVNQKCQKKSNASLLSQTTFLLLICFIASFFF